MKTDHPKERDLFSVKKGRESLSQKKKRGTKRKKGEDDISLSEGKKRKKEELIDEFDEEITYVPLSYQQIPVGQVVLGCILKVFKYEMIVSLPNRMQGHLPIMNISKSYNDLLTKISGRENFEDTFYNLDEIYSTGHLVVTKIKSVVPYENGTSRIILSILPEDVNKELSTSSLCENSIVQSAVLTKEENGYVMNTGMRNIRAAFLPKEFAPTGTVGVGSVFLCSVKKIFNPSDKGMINLSLSADPSFMNIPLTLSDNLNIASVVPGCLINAKVKKILFGGLELSIKNFRGFVTVNHLKSHQIIKKNYKVGQTVIARVLYFQELTSAIYCSLNSKLCSPSVLRRNWNKFSIGDVCSAMVSKKTKEDIHFTLEKNQDCHGYISREKSTPTNKKLLKHLEVNSEVTCRVRHIHLIDQLYVLSLETKESLEREDLFVGKIVSVRIAEHTDNGALGLVVGTGKIGFIPKMHFPDLNEDQEEEICRVGVKYEARILRFTTDKDLQLTLKGDLVNCDLPLVTEFSEKYVGCVTMGSIVKCYNRGILVQLFGGAKAIIPIHHIPHHMQNNYWKFFNIGSVVKCRIASYDSEEQKLTASLFLVAGQKKIEVSKLYDTEIHSEHVVKQCKVNSIKKDGVDVHINDFNGEAHIPWYHMADDIETSRAIFPLLKVGDEIENAVVFSQIDQGLILSLKPSFCRYLRDVTKADDRIKCGSVRPSVISQIFDNKIVVTTNGVEVKHSIKKDCVFNEEVTSLKKTDIQIGQTLVIKCTKAEKEKPLKFVSYLKTFMQNCRASSLQLLYDIINIESQMRKIVFERMEFNLDKINIGSSHIGKVLYVCKAGALVRITELSLEGIIRPIHYSESGVPILNKSIQVRILKSYYKEKCLELTARDDIKKFFSLCNPDIKVGQEDTCEVLLANKDYVIGRLESLCEGQIVYLPSRRHINDFKSRQLFYEVGKKYEVVIEYVTDSFILANLKIHSDMESIHIDEDHPCFNFKDVSNPRLSDSFILDKNSLTKHDFITKAKQKIETVLKVEKKSKKGDTGDTDSGGPSKLDALQDDNFTQFDDQIYWECIKQQRKERKKLRKQKYGRIKVRKANVVDRKTT